MSELAAVMADDDLVPQTLARAVKYGLDRVLAAIILVLASPLLVIIALLVMLDGGPMIFGHRRLGQNGREFRCLKFRTMLVDGEPMLARALADPAVAAEWAANHKLRDDPRITRFGRFLRVTSLDELPQLVNVLRGEMSLVGPRPIVQAETARYGRDLGYYLGVKPGLTGLWQVSGRSDTSYRERVGYDITYVKTWSLGRDFIIMLRTIQVIMTREGSV